VLLVGGALVFTHILWMRGISAVLGQIEDPAGVDEVRIG
jgi:hypothetical protein